MYRIVADHMIIFYSTFMLIPTSAQRKGRMLLLVLLVATVLVQLCLYEAVPELQDFEDPIKQGIFSVPYLADFAIFNICDLIQFTISGVMQASLLIWTLAARSARDLVIDIDRCCQLDDDGSFKQTAERLIDNFEGCVSSIEQSTKAKRYVTFAMTASCIVIGGALTLDYLDEKQR